MGVAALDLGGGGGTPSGKPNAKPSPDPGAGDTPEDLGGGGGTPSGSALGACAVSGTTCCWLPGIVRGGGKGTPSGKPSMEVLPSIVGGSSNAGGP